VFLLQGYYWFPLFSVELDGIARVGLSAPSGSFKNEVGGYFVNKALQLYWERRRFIIEYPKIFNTAFDPINSGVSIILVG